MLLMNCCLFNRSCGPGAQQCGPKYWPSVIELACKCIVGKKTAPMFVHFGKIGMVRNSDISRKSQKTT